MNIYTFRCKNIKVSDYEVTTQNPLGMLINIQSCLSKIRKMLKFETRLAPVVTLENTAFRDTVDLRAFCGSHNKCVLSASTSLIFSSL